MHRASNQSQLSMSISRKVSVFLSGFVALALSFPVQAATTQCQIQPRAGQPSPLAMRALFTLESNSGGTVTATYTNLPTPVGVAPPPVTIEQTRKLVFYKTTIPAVRQRMLRERALFTELLGFDEPGGFKPFNDLLVCRSIRK
jgi:hypothetical protein